MMELKHLTLAVGLALGVLASAQAGEKKPNILVIWGDDIGTWNISHNNRGMMGYQTPNIDRLGKEGVYFTDYYGQQSCTAGRAAFVGGCVPVRTGMTKVGLPGAKEGWQKTDVTIATVLKGQGYATGQFGKNHFGDRDERPPPLARRSACRAHYPPHQLASRRSPSCIPTTCTRPSSGWGQPRTTHRSH